MPGIGGFVGGNKELIDYLRFGSNGYIFSTGLPPSVLGGLIAAIDILETEPEIQDKIHRNSAYIRNELKSRGLDTMNSASAIIPVLLPDRITGGKFLNILHERGVYVNGVSFPAVPLKSPRLRLNINALLTLEDIEFALTQIEETARELNII